MYNLDPTWLPFSNLMLKHIYNVLLICSDYDRFLLEVDGRVEEALYSEYTQLGLSNPPKITHANSPVEAMKLLNSNREFELVISMLDIGDEKVEEFADDVKIVFPELPFVVLSPSPIHKRNKQIKKITSIDNFFYYQGDPMIFLAMIKLMEDSINIDHDTKEADIQVIILVENSVRFYSSFLPLLYQCLILQNRSSILEGLNNWGKILRMRGRPKIVLAKDYEEADYLYTRYKNNILGIITDMSFNKDGKEHKFAGLELTKQIKKENANLPILIQSMDKNVRDDVVENGAEFLWKKSSRLLSRLHEYVITHYGFGPFLFKDPSTGDIIWEAKSMSQLQKAIANVPIESFLYHAQRNDYSKWLRAQSLYRLAAQMKPMIFDVHNEEEAEIARLKTYDTIKTYRAERTKGVIASFNKDYYDETLFFSRIGSGSLGGKGRGLAFIDKEVRACKMVEKYPDVYLAIPRTVVIATDVFDNFIELNDLKEFTMEETTDSEVLKRFLESDIPSDLEEDLREVITVITQPISIRSSSLLEDSHFQPFAGVYETCMIANTGDDAKRLHELKNAIKTVWASTYFNHAKDYLQATDHILEEEKMAIVIQQVIGSQHGDYWYPNISGVARSLNYYPLPEEQTTDGIGMLSFGFGKSVVDNGSVLRFSPKNPKRPVHFLGGGQVSSQTKFYALNMNQPYDPTKDIDNLEILDVKEAASHPETLHGIASTLTETGAMSESFRAKGEKIITFNGILQYDYFPLANIVRDLLTLGKDSMGTPVEIEFAVNLNKTEPKKPEFSILQIRPIAEGNEEECVQIRTDEIDDALIYSKS
ncbi:MAG: PEP/pyruvate-binding domain-containing protein, partial [Sphaerochaetaceae bacterium]